MNELICSGPVPDRILEKAHRLLNKTYLKNKIGWKKIARLNGWYSCRLNMNYRLLKDADGAIYVCKHEVYEKKIKSKNLT